MATTRIADVPVQVEVFGPAMVLESLNLDLFIQSGVVVRDRYLDEFLSFPSETAGLTYSPRYLGPLPDVDPYISTDDPDQKSVPYKITGYKNTAIRQDLNNSWSSMDLTAQVMGQDPLAIIQSQIAKYWQTVRQKRLLASLQGIIEENINNHDSDMVIDISGGSGADALFGPDTFIDARATLGDRINQLSAVALHSTVYANLLKQDLIDFIQPSNSSAQIPVYQGIQVIVDDGMTAASDGQNGVVYYTYVFGSGAVAMGMGNAKVPLETERKPDAGMGGGEERVYSRVAIVVHPQGFSWKGPIGAGHPTMAELKNPDNWTRAWERKRVPLACLISRG